MKYNKPTKEFWVGDWAIAKFCDYRSIFSPKLWWHYRGWGKPSWHQFDHGVRHVGPILWYRRSDD